MTLLLKPWRQLVHALCFFHILLVPKCIADLQCYTPDGSLAADDQKPCNGTADATHCCQSGAACLTNGLCFLQWDTSVNTGTCTDRTWNEPRCFQPCLQCTFLLDFAHYPQATGSPCGHGPKISEHPANSISSNYLAIGRISESVHSLPLRRQLLVLLCWRKHYILLPGKHQSIQNPRDSTDPEWIGLHRWLHNRTDRCSENTYCRSRDQRNWWSSTHNSGFGFRCYVLPAGGGGGVGQCFSIG